MARVRGGRKGKQNGSSEILNQHQVGIGVVNLRPNDSAAILADGEPWTAKNDVVTHGSDIGHASSGKIEESDQLRETFGYGQIKKVGSSVCYSPKALPYGIAD